MHPGEAALHFWDGEGGFREEDGDAAADGVERGAVGADEGGFERDAVGENDAGEERSGGEGEGLSRDGTTQEGENTLVDHGATQNLNDRDTEGTEGELGEE